jgi:hypothetical protein
MAKRIKELLILLLFSRLSLCQNFANLCQQVNNENATFAKYLSDNYHTEDSLFLLCDAYNYKTAFLFRSSLVPFKYGENTDKLLKVKEFEIDDEETSKYAFEELNNSILLQKQIHFEKIVGCVLTETNKEFRHKHGGEFEQCETTKRLLHLIYDSAFSYESNFDNKSGLELYKNLNLPDKLKVLLQIANDLSFLEENNLFLEELSFDNIDINPGKKVEAEIINLGNIIKVDKELPNNYLFKSDKIN